MISFLSLPVEMMIGNQTSLYAAKTTALSTKVMIGNKFE